jgi:3-oxoacyl-[acyl-carrier protein] reductase
LISVDERRRVCLFTGISGTLGRDFSARYADTYDLVGVYHSTRPVGRFCPLDRDERGPPGSWFGIEIDLGREGAVDDLVELVHDRFGSVDLLVNAAVYSRLGPIEDREFVDTLGWHFALNVCVPMELTAALLERTWRDTPDANRRIRRNVVNLSSTAGHRVYPGHGQSAYGSTKAAINMVTRHLASELAPFGVRANAIAPNSFPGLVPTETVSDAVVRYDQSDRSGDILVIDVDGEYLLAEPGRRH